METQIFSTEGLDRENRLTNFQNDFGRIWGSIKLQSVQAKQTYGRIESHRFSDLRFNKISLKSLKFSRITSSNSAKNQSPFAVMAFPISGKATIVRGDDEHTFTPGLAFFVRHVVHDITYVPNQYDTFNIQIPMHLFERRTNRIPLVQQMELEPGSSARVFQHFVTGLQSELPLSQPEDMPVLADQLCDMLAMLLNRPTQISERESSSLRMHRGRILRNLEAMVGEQELTPSKIAKDMGVSVSHLHRIFAAGQASIMVEVRLLRVERARRMLANSRKRRLQISEISYKCGFRSPQDFSRVFRQQYGISPSHFRAMENGECNLEREVDTPYN